VITQADVQKTANHWKLEDHIIEKDYVLGWLLWGIAKHPILSKEWVLKGGMALKSALLLACKVVPIWTYGQRKVE